MIDTQIKDIIWNRTSDLIFIKSIDLKYTMVNSALLKFFNHKENIIGKTDDEIYSKKLADQFRLSDKKALKKGHVRVLQEIQLGDKIYYLFVLKQIIYDHQGNPSGIFGMTQDISELILTKKELEFKNTILEKIFKLSPNPIFIKNQQGEYTMVNIAYANMHKKTITEIVGKTNIDLFSEEDAIFINQQDQKILETGMTMTYQYNVTIANKDYIIITTKGLLTDNSGKIIGIIGFSNDITDAIKLDHKIIEADRLHSVGVLAGGIAHDMNNILTGISGYASMLAFELKDSNYVDHVDNIINSTTHATRLINKLLLYSKTNKRDIVSINLNHLIHETFDLLRPNIGKNISIHFELHSKIIIDADISHMNQLVMNMIMNSADAIENHGQIRIITSEDEIYDMTPYRFVSEKALPGKYIKFTVMDTGSGISEENQKKIFEPFFTTKKKKTKKGTGLGLYIVLSVVDAHKGILDLHSEIGVGTTIDVYLPESKSVKFEDVTYNKELIHGSGKILVVDDEKLILNLLNMILPKLGYSAVLFDDPIEAIDYYAKYYNRIDAVILDMIMPNLDGYQTLEKMKEINPDIRAMLSSGYGREEKLEDLYKIGFKCFLGKPYDMEDLSIKLNSMLHDEE